MSQNKIPMRRCIGCMVSFPKKSLCRIVKAKIDDNKYEVCYDKTGKVNGRGAYICKNVECLEKAIKSKRLAKSLEIEIPIEIYENIKRELL